MGPVWAILRKECATEWRTRYGLNAALLFAVTSLVAVSFAVGRMPDRPDLLAALLWITLLFAALASMSHAFVRERESHTLMLLRLVASPAPSPGGEVPVNAALLAILQVVPGP